jgi:predicted  nucleic acid-binding Zn-ribbon protein
MKGIFYIIIFGILLVILLYSLFLYNKNSNKNNNNININNKIQEKFLIPNKPVVTSVDFVDGFLSIGWNKPVETSDITGYIIMVKKNNDIEDGLFMKFSSEIDCEKCKYEIKNLKLDEDSEYVVSVMAVNKEGTGLPSDITKQSIFKTPLPTSVPTQSVLHSQQTPIPTIFAEDKIKLADSQKKNYLDDELQNMIIRADGVYEVNKDTLSYPDISIDDVKQSIHTINDAVKKDLQEYRLNIHLMNSSNQTNQPIF